mmetsp:Transcript_24122/g.75671  ORF Transcript_24122/g.75671 Transcript_24122/m.75671 type:complete len:500 (-) Transcript_24122:114-1613(-)
MVTTQSGKPAPGGAAFMARLEEATLADHPKTPPPEVPAPPFSAFSVRCTLPVIYTLAVDTLILARPWILAALVAAPAAGAMPLAYALPLALCLAAWLLQYDFQLQRKLGRYDRVRPGTYFKGTPRNIHIASQVPCMGSGRAAYRPTPWLWNGDLSTLFPFMFYSSAPAPYVRRWVRVPPSEGPSAPATGHGSGEYAVALDVCLPPGGHDPSRPCLIITHGLNGGSDEPYVLDCVHAAVERGWTACVMIARGLMGTPVGGDAAFTGARTSDIETVAGVLAAALGPDTPLMGVGYSMGAIIMNNYVCKAGAGCPLWGAVSIAGTFDAGYNKGFEYSRRHWQPILAQKLKKNFVEPNTAAAVRRRVDLRVVESAFDVVDFDTAMVVPYHGYESVDHYYEDMSAGRGGKVDGLRVPLFVLHACDDPVMHVDGLPVHRTEDLEDLFFLITPEGGHVGWPTGWNPMDKQWRWMSTAVLDFCGAVPCKADASPASSSRVSPASSRA